MIELAGRYQTLASQGLVQKGKKWGGYGGSGLSFTNTEKSTAQKLRNVEKTKHGIGLTMDDIEQGAENEGKEKFDNGEWKSQKILAQEQAMKKANTAHLIASTVVPEPEPPKPVEPIPAPLPPPPPPVPNVLPKAPPLPAVSTKVNPLEAARQRVAAVLAAKEAGPPLVPIEDPKANKTETSNNNNNNNAKSANSQALMIVNPLTGASQQLALVQKKKDMSSVPFLPKISKEEIQKMVIQNEMQYQKKLPFGHVSRELEINDYPEIARKAVQARERRNDVMERTQTKIDIRGQYFDPKIPKNRLPEGYRKLFIEISGPSQMGVDRAYKEMYTIVEETAKTTLKIPVGRMVKRKYNLTG